MVDGEVGSVRVCPIHCIGLFRRSGGDAVICFCMHDKTKGDVYSISGGALCWLWGRRRKVKLAQIVRKCNAERIKNKRRSRHHSC